MNQLAVLVLMRASVSPKRLPWRARSAEDFHAVGGGGEVPAFLLLLQPAAVSTTLVAGAEVLFDGFQG